MWHMGSEESVLIRYRGDYVYDETGALHRAEEGKGIYLLVALILKSLS